MLPKNFAIVGVAGFVSLHTKVYEDTLAGRGFGIEDARPSIDLAHRLRTTPVSPPSDVPHPLLKGKL